MLTCVVEGDRVLAILPLITDDHRHFSGFTHLYSSLFSLLLAEQDQQAVLQCLVKGFKRLKMWSLKLDPVAEDDRHVEMLRRVMESKGYSCHSRFRFYNWIYRVQGKRFEAYMAERPSRVRNTIKRKQRKLEREYGGYEVRLFGLNDLEQGLADYNTVYRASWKPHEQFDGFVDGLARTLSETGWLRLAVLYIDQKPAAAQFWFVVHDKASIFKLVYDQAWKQYSPGSILISYLMHYVIETDRVNEIDFLTGNDAYKQDWMSERRQRVSISLFRPRQPEGLLKKLINPIKTLFLTD